MPSKIEVGKVAEIIKKHQVDPATARQIIEEMNAAVQPTSDDDSPPPVKKQWVCIISKPEGGLDSAEDIVGWVLQIPESDSSYTVKERVERAANDYNTSKKGRLLPVTTLGDTIENVPAKYFKEHGVWAKTKTPVHFLPLPNALPKTTIDVDHRKSDALD